MLFGFDFSTQKWIFIYTVSALHFSDSIRRL